MNVPMPPKGSLDLYKKTVEIHRQAFKRPSHNSEKYKKLTGHMLQHIFGKWAWTLKDLDDEQLLYVIGWAEHKLDRSKPRPQPFIKTA